MLWLRHDILFIGSNSRKHSPIVKSQTKQLTTEKSALRLLCLSIHIHSYVSQAFKVELCNNNSHPALPGHKIRLIFPLSVWHQYHSSNSWSQLHVRYFVQLIFKGFLQMKTYSYCMELYWLSTLNRGQLKHTSDLILERLLIWTTIVATNYECVPWPYMRGGMW